MAGFGNTRAATTATASGLNGTMYVSLHSADPAGTGANELSGNGYARQAITLTETSRVWENDDSETFTASGGDFATATHVALWIVSTGGTVEYEGALASSKTITDGESGIVNAGEITVTL